MTVNELQTYMTDALGPLPFCPGCGHERLLKDLDKALVSLQLDPKMTVVVSDIGCISEHAPRRRRCRHLSVASAFHGSGQGRFLYGGRI